MELAVSWRRQALCWRMAPTEVFISIIQPQLFQLIHVRCSLYCSLMWCLWRDILLVLNRFHEVRFIQMLCEATLIWCSLYHAKREQVDPGLFNRGQPLPVSLGVLNIPGLISRRQAKRLLNCTTCVYNGKSVSSVAFALDKNNESAMWTEQFLVNLICGWGERGLQELHPTRWQVRRLHYTHYH